MQKKVFIGYINIASVGLGLKEGFEKIGLRADIFIFNNDKSKYHYTENDLNKPVVINYSKIKFIRYIQFLLHFVRIFIKYNYFIYLSAGEGYLFTNFKDIKFLKFFKKKAAVIFTGCDVRIPDEVKGYKWNPCTNCSDSYKKFTGCSIPRKLKYLEDLENNFDYIFSPLECGGAIKKEYFDIKFPVKEPVINIKTEMNKSIRILHAPSNEDYKGSKYIYNVINKLKVKYEIEFAKIENVSKDELFYEIMKSDIIIDQMLVGFYGVFAVESMLLEKPVVCFIRNDIWEKIKNDSPVINADPDSLYEHLEKLILNRNELLNIGKRSREYAMKYHSPENVTRYILNTMDSNNYPL